MSWLFPVLCIFLVGVLFGGALGYMVAYIKYNKSKPPAPGEQQVLADADLVPGRPREVGMLARRSEEVPLQGVLPQPEAPRNRRPEVRVPDQVLITRTGGSYHRVSGCSATTRGEETHTNRKLDKCGLCYPVHREE